jgi:GH43 family beta-xylosidase
MERTSAPGQARSNEPLRKRPHATSQRIASLLWCIGLLGAAIPSWGGIFTNAIISDGADPWIVFKDGYYYLTATTGGDVKVRQATRLAGTNGIGAASPVRVFKPPAPYNQEVWAPELHFIQGKAYLYYAADDGTNENHRMFCAEQVGQTTSFAYKGKVYDTTTDCWAIDGTVLQATNGALYFIWSGWPGAENGLQNLYIAPMSNPWTISGPRVLLSTPTRSWESWIQEGPEVLQRNGKVFVVYAANLSWTDNECLGMLINSDGNYLNPASWTKLSQPVFKTVTGTNGSVFGPGHASYTQSLDGTEDWIFYHAAQYQGAGWTRNIRMQRFTWDANGYPSFGQPVPAGIPIANPSGDDFTPALVESVAMQRNGWATVTARAPLPLLTNQWAVEASEDLKTWSVLTNAPALQYSVSARDSTAASNRFYRVRSRR